MHFARILHLDIYIGEVLDATIIRVSMRDYTSLELFLVAIAAINYIPSVESFTFEDDVRMRPVASRILVTTRRPPSHSRIDNIFQIPISVIQGTSAAAQSWSPENSDTINKVFDIPVQTLQAVGNVVKDRRRPHSASSSPLWSNTKHRKKRNKRKYLMAFIQTLLNHQQGPTGVHEIIGGDDNIYHVTEDIDDARIQNKIAPPGFTGWRRRS